MNDVWICIAKLESETSNSRLIDERCVSTGKEEVKEISRAEKEAIYCEVIYTIKHKIGRTIDGHNDYIQDLYKYTQDAFKMAQADHDRLYVQACEEKVKSVYQLYFLWYSFYQYILNEKHNEKWIQIYRNFIRINKLHKVIINFFVNFMN